MSLEDVFDRVKLINAGITGIQKAYTYNDLPQSLNTAGLPAAVPILESFTLGYSAGQRAHDHYTITIGVYVSPLGQGSIAQNFGAAVPFVERFKERYALALKLNALDYVEQALLTGGEVGLLMPFETEYVGVAFRLEVDYHEPMETGV